MYRKFIKRLLDILISVFALPVFFIIMIILAPIIYLSDKGTIFYSAPRLGKGGKIFNMLKFRSMKMNAPDIRNSDGSTFNSESDIRLTGFGKVLRKTSIDEIPQILNVLKGDMSIIGPRPDLPEHIKEYIGDEVRKLEVRPGITGLSQAYVRNSLPWKQRIKLDIQYIDQMSFLLDLKIIFKTIFSIFKKENVYVSNKQGEKCE